MIDFYEMLVRQKKLDEVMTHHSPRGESEIIISMIAEIIEFQEELKETHKTWKNKQYKRENALEEFVDILFFWSQYILLGNDALSKNRNKYFNSNYTKYTDNDFERIPKINDCIIYLIWSLCEGCKYKVEEYLGAIAQIMNFTDDEINKCHEEKFKKNLQRVGVEWL